MRRICVLILMSALLVCLIFAYLSPEPNTTFQTSPIIRKVAKELGSKYWVVLLLGGLISAWRKRSSLLPLILTLSVGQILVEAMKFFVEEVRPNGRFFDSFPSGHSAACFCYASVMAIHFPRWGRLWFLFALSVSISRLVVNAHWWYDVLGGGALGCLVAMTMLTLTSNKASVPSPKP